MAIPPMPVDVHAAGEFDFVRATARYADRDRTQQATTSDGRLRWRVELQLVPTDERASAEIIRVSFAGPRPAFDRNERVLPVGLTVGEFNGSVYMTADGFRPYTAVDGAVPAIDGVNPFGTQED